VAGQAGPGLSPFTEWREALGTPTGKRVYFAGVTECLPHTKALRD